jgi:hypothetical protein
VIVQKPMTSVLRKSTLPEMLDRLRAESKNREVLIDEPEDGSVPVRDYLAAVRKAHRSDCIVLPPGEYPVPQVTRNLALRALRPGTVTLKGADGQPALEVSGDARVWLSGIELVPGTPADPAIRQSGGTIILASCQIVGGIEVTGGAAIHCASCAISGAASGLALSGGASAEILSSTFSNCPLGIFAGKGCSLVVQHSRIEGSVGKAGDSTGVGIRAEDATVHCEGSVFLANDIGAHLDACKDARFLFCLFDRQSLCGLTMRGGGSLRAHGCVFRAQASSDHAHVALENIAAEVDFCEMDSSAADGVTATGGQIRRRKLASAKPPAAGDVIAHVLASLNEDVGMDEAKSVIETILHQTYAALERRKLGRQVPPLKFHCIFEGPEGSGRRRSAAVLLRALHTIGAVSGTGGVSEVHIEDLLSEKASLAKAVETARGGLLMLHAAQQLGRRDARLSFSRTREILRQALAACRDDTILIFTGPRDSVRPVLCNSQETEEMFRATIHFSLPSPPEVAEMFARLAAAQNIRLTTMARIKILLSLHMMHDRRYRRFLNSTGIAKLLEAAQKRYDERCSRERDFELPMDAQDIDVPVEKLADPLLLSHPAFVAICPSCESENPWVPGLEKSLHCAACGHAWRPGWGIWTGSTFYRMKTSDEEEMLPLGLPPHRKPSTQP